MGTRVYVERTGRRVMPFDDPPSEVRIGDRPLSAWQAEAFAEAGLSVVDTLQAPCLVVPDTLFTTGAVLRRFVEGAAGKDAVLGLADSRFGERTAHVQPGVRRVDGGWRFDAIRWQTGDSPVEDAPVVWIDPEERVVELPLPRAFREDPDGDTPDTISLARHPVMTIHHWVHVLWANQAAGAVVASRIPWWWTAIRVVWGVLRTWSLNKWRLLRYLNRVGRGCDIHPTALVEGSTLGDGVTVGPHARVLFSHVGDGATILAGAQVEVSTLGAEATVAQQTVLRLCVLYPGAFAGQTTMQACVVGRDTLTTQASYAIDLNFDRTIRVPMDGTLWDTGTRFLGSAFGHACRIGTGVWIAPGRSFPNGTELLRDPAQVVSRPPGDPGGRWVAEDGGVRRLGARLDAGADDPDDTAVTD